ncbi:HPr kinase/phosphorylase [Jannaschia formosa]|uniref:HPr kinase/phosphorylase n=1 Tax=Jannaschia formosa TaxID=2259592 RepID=UPI000E1BC2D8|nr:serine kinase [Jannaschia formosa]TFL17478.1 serine kinase [Jannaschia formosa]
MAASSGPRTSAPRTWTSRRSRWARASSSACPSERVSAWRPETHRVGTGIHAIHATAVSVAGRGLLILGPSRAGKSSLACQMIALGAALVSDDRVEIGPGPRLRRPPEGPAMIELRGLGLVACATEEAALAAALLLGPSAARLPERETIALAGHDVPLLRHPAMPELAAKLILWLRAAA